MHVNDVNVINDVNVYVGWVREHKEANLRYGNCQPNSCYMKFVYEAPMICFVLFCFFSIHQVFN